METPSDPLPDPALRLLDLFPTFERAFCRWAQSLIESSGVSPARIRLLAALHCKGPQIMSSLGDELGVTARNVTTLVDALEEEGLVQRKPHPTDRRATVIELTPEGFEWASATLAPYKEKIAGLFRDLPEGDQHQLLRLMETLLEALRQREQGVQDC